MISLVRMPPADEHVVHFGLDRYALVAVFNFFSTTCQYQALRVGFLFAANVRSRALTPPDRPQYVSYTTQSLGMSLVAPHCEPEGAL